MTALKFTMFHDKLFFNFFQFCGVNSVAELPTCVLLEYKTWPADSMPHLGPFIGHVKNEPNNRLWSLVPAF